MIICQMSSTRPELFHWFLFPLALVVYAAISGLLGWMEEAVLAVFTALVTAAHVHYGVCVVSGRLQSGHRRAALGWGEDGVWERFLCCLVGAVSGSLNVQLWLAFCVLFYSV